HLLATAEASVPLRRLARQRVAGGRLDLGDLGPQLLQAGGRGRSGQVDRGGYDPEAVESGFWLINHAAATPLGPHPAQTPPAPGRGSGRSRSARLSGRAP